MPDELDENEVRPAKPARSRSEEKHLERLAKLPPLEGVRAFEAAARHKSFVGAADELNVTAATVSLRVKALEEHLQRKLFERRARGIELNAVGRDYIGDVQRVLEALSDASERRRRRGTHKQLKLVAVEAFAEKWLTPRLADFAKQHPEIAIEFETDHREVSTERRDFDVWIAFTEDEDAGPEGDTLFDEALLPVCSAGFLSRHGRPETAAQLRELPLLYDLHWRRYWSHWFQKHGVQTPNLSKAHGFRLYSMMIQAAVDGMGVALGHALIIQRELEQGTLVPIFKGSIKAPARYVLVTAPGAESKEEVQTFRKWIEKEADRERDARAHC